MKERKLKWKEKPEGKRNSVKKKKKLKFRSIKTNQQSEVK